MRLVACATLALGFVAGCGADGRELDPVSVRGRLNVPSAAARAGVIDATWNDAAGDQLHVTSGERTDLSVKEELSFPSVGGARRIDVEVLRASLQPLAATIDAKLTLDGEPLEAGARVTLAALDRATLGLGLSCDRADVQDVPNGVDLDLLLRPIVFGGDP
jgi:hypothetical protein